MRYKKVIVDIDNTLWDFASVLYERIIRVNPKIPSPEGWSHWDFWKDFISAENFYRTIREIHAEQDKFGIYPYAKDFLKELKKLNYRIIIASHRDRESEYATMRWLDRNHLIFDDLHLSYDKTILFSNCHVVVDDSPHVLGKALKQNLQAAGLEFPWNRDNGFDLFKNLEEILKFIRQKNG